MLDENGDAHGARRVLCPPHARKTGGERVHPREGDGGEGHRADEANEDGGISLGKGGKEQFCSDWCEKKQSRRRGEGEG